MINKFLLTIQGRLEDFLGSHIEKRRSVAIYLNNKIIQAGSIISADREVSHCNEGRSKQFSTLVEMKCVYRYVSKMSKVRGLSGFTSYKLVRWHANGCQCRRELFDIMLLCCKRHFWKNVGSKWPIQASLALAYRRNL